VTNFLYHILFPWLLVFCPFCFQQFSEPFLIPTN
jgi:hypothetical protein